MKPLSLSQPHLIVMIGIPGSGKSTFAERFSETFKAPYVSHPDLQYAIFGAKYGSASQEEKAVELAYVLLTELLKTNQTIVYEDATGSRQYRQELAKVASKAGYTPHFVWVQTDSTEASRRAKRKASLTPDQFEQFTGRFNVPVVSELPIVISGKHTYASQLKNVLKNLAADRGDRPLRVPTRNIKIQ